MFFEQYHLKQFLRFFKLNYETNNLCKKTDTFKTLSNINDVTFLANIINSFYKSRQIFLENKSIVDVSQCPKVHL